MPAKLTLHPPQRASRFLVIQDRETILVGRDPECGLVLEDPRVSKKHARLSWDGEGWSLEDLRSKNGTSVNGFAASGAPLAHGDWLSFGGIFGRFERLTEEDVRSLQAERLSRLETSIERRRRLGADLEPFDLLYSFLQTAMELTSAERGFVLVAGPDAALRVEVAAGFSSDQIADDRFAGSAGAVRKVLETGEAIVVCDAQADPILGKRPSVMGMGLGSLACVPIRQDDDIVGMIYVDSRERSAGFTDLDLEILESLAEHAAVALATIRIGRRLRGLVGKDAPSASPEIIEELQRRIGEVVKSDRPAL